MQVTTKEWTVVAEWKTGRTLHPWHAPGMVDEVAFDDMIVAMRMYDDGIVELAQRRLPRTDGMPGLVMQQLAIRRRVPAEGRTHWFGREFTRRLCAIRDAARAKVPA